MSDPGWIAIDTNVICRHALNDHDTHSPRARNLFESLAQGGADIFCPDTAIFEAVYILHGLNEAPRSDVQDYFATIIPYPGFHLEHPGAVLSALEFWVQHSPLDFADCYHLALTKELGMTQIYTFDKKMDRFPGVERIEP